MSNLRLKGMSKHKRLIPKQLTPKMNRESKQHIFKWIGDNDIQRVSQCSNWNTNQPKKYNNQSPDMPCLLQSTSNQPEARSKRTITVSYRGNQQTASVGHTTQLQLCSVRVVIWSWSLVICSGALVVFWVALYWFWRMFRLLLVFLGSVYPANHT